MSINNVKNLIVSDSDLVIKVLFFRPRPKGWGRAIFSSGWYSKKSQSCFALASCNELAADVLIKNRK